MSQMMLSLLTAGTFVVTASSVLLLLYLFPTALTHVFDVIFFCGGVAGVHQMVEPAIVAFVDFAKVRALRISRYDWSFCCQAQQSDVARRCRRTQGADDA